MLMLYFSGTGNSKYIANLFSKKVNAKCYSIEENIDFKKEIKRHNTIAFCYPIYASNVPRIMREFVSKYVEELKDKKLIIFCTQLFFSGDGARVFTDLLPKGYGEVIYAEHFNMPNNICNIKIFPIKNGEETKKYIKAAIEKQLNGDGFAMVEILSPCPTNWHMTPVAAMKHIEQETIQYYPLGEMVNNVRVDGRMVKKEANDS